MVVITFSLLRRRYPDLNAENLDSLAVIELNGQNITGIDNLELASHIKALHLNHNSIKIIENLEFMVNLEHLDLSFNEIDSDGLLQSFQALPPSLGSINLSGNPCADDDSVLSALQDRFPNLGIIVGEIDETELSPTAATDKGHMKRLRQEP